MHVGTAEINASDFEEEDYFKGKGVSVMSDTLLLSLSLNANAAELFLANLCS
jgi:hypothetical protein